METHPIDWEHWARSAHFTHYLEEIPCTYDMTVRLDVTRLRQAAGAGRAKFYPALLWLTARVVNRHEELRLWVDGTNRPWVYQVLHPSYTVFHPETETFSNLWTPYDPDWKTFARSWAEVHSRWGKETAFTPQPDLPENCFPFSMLPWTSFSGFQLGLPRGERFLLPVFTAERYQTEDGRVQLPLAVRFHHAACDGFHAARLFQELQAELDGFDPEGDGA